MLGRSSHYKENSMGNFKKIIFVALFVCGSWSLLAAQEAKFVELNGSVEFRESGDMAWQTAALDSSIGKNTIISTGMKSSAVIAVGSSTVTVRPLTMLTLEELTQQDGTEEAVLYLRTGRVQADVTPPSGLKADFTVRSPTTTASVRGTSFDFNGQNLAVKSGKVSFSNQNGQKVYVNAGQSSYADAGSQHIKSPYKAKEEQFSSSIPELASTGGGGDSQTGSSTQQKVKVIISWPRGE